MRKKRLAFTPLAIEGIQHYGPPDSDDDDAALSLDLSPAVHRRPPDNNATLSLDLSPEARHRPAVVAAGRGGATTGGTGRNKRRGYARSASERKERRRERRSNRSRPPMFVRAGNAGEDFKENAGGNNNAAPGAAGGDSEDDAIGSPEEEFDINGDENEMDVGDEEYSDATRELEDSDFGGSTEFHVHDNNGDDDSEDYDDYDAVQKRLFSSTVKKRRVILDDEEEDEEESIIVDMEEDTRPRSKSKRSRETRKRNETTGRKTKSNADDDPDDENLAPMEAENKSSRFEKSTEPKNSNRSNLYGGSNLSVDSIRVGKNKKISPALSSKRKKVSPAKACTEGPEDNAKSKKNDKAYPSKSGKRVLTNKKLDLSKASKSSSVMNSFVKAAEEAMAAAEAAESRAAKVEAAAKKSRMKQQEEWRFSANKKNDDVGSKDEDETSFDFDDEASEYQPTQGEDKVSQVANKISPRPSRRCSSRRNIGRDKDESKKDAQPSTKDQIGTTLLVTRRRRKKSGHIIKAKGSKALEPEEEEVCIPSLPFRKESSSCSKSSKSNSCKNGKRKSAKGDAPGDGEERKEAHPRTAKRSRKKDDLSRAQNNKREESLDLDDSASSGSNEGDKAVCQDKTKSRSKKTRSSKTNSGKREKPLNVAHVAPSGEGRNVIHPSTRKSENSKSKAESFRINHRKKEDGKIMDIDHDDFGGEEEGSNANARYGDGASNTDDIEVEYHEAEEDNDAEINESFCDGGTLLTQAAASQFMEQSFSSSTAEAERSNQSVPGFDEAGLGTNRGTEKMQSIVMSTRDISKLQPRLSQFGETFSVSSSAGGSVVVKSEGKNILSAKSESGDFLSNDGPREESGPEKSSKTAKHNHPEENFTSAIELSTRVISNVDPDAFLAEMQTQSQIQGRSQLSSAVSPETRASMAADSLGDIKSENHDSEGSLADENIANLEENESARTSNMQNNTQNKCIKTLDKMSPEEMTQALKKMGRHIREVRKIWKQVSSQIGVSCDEGSSV